MRRFVLPVIALSMAAAVSAQEIQWHTTYESARAEALHTGKPLLIAFRCVP